MKKKIEYPISYETVSYMLMKYNCFSISTQSYYDKPITKVTKLWDTIFFCFLQLTSNGISDFSGRFWLCLFFYLEMLKRTVSQFMKNKLNLTTKASTISSNKNNIQKQYTIY